MQYQLTHCDVYLMHLHLAAAVAWSQCSEAATAVLSVREGLAELLDLSGWVGVGWCPAGGQGGE
jgi:hypothetical protein